jgi:integrase
LLATGRTVYRLAAMGKTGEATIQFYDETAVFAHLALGLLPENAVYIFVNGRTGQLLHEDSLRDAFKRICKFAGVPKFSFQATRKRTVRDAIVLTGDEKAGQLIAGHKDIRTTHLHYNDMDQDDVDEVGAIVANARRGPPDNLATAFFRKAGK